MLSSVLKRKENLEKKYILKFTDTTICVCCFFNDNIELGDGNNFFSQLMFLN